MLFERLTRQLVPGGFLVVGNAERPPASLKLTQVARCVYRTNGA
jgi:chemotaxis methyl-accepting protein methylase